MNRNRTGFTLIELLIVIGIIGFLASAILVAVDPVRRIQESRNSKRWSEVNAILNAILTKQVDDRDEYDGEALAPIITQAGDNVQVIVRDDTGIECSLTAQRPGCDKPMDTSNGKQCVANIGTDGVDKLVPEYIAEIPFDPLGEGTETPCRAGTTTACTTLGNLAIGDDNTGYYVARTANGRLEVGACYPDRDVEISVKR